MALAALIAATYALALTAKARDRAEFERYLHGVVGNSAHRLVGVTFAIEAALASAAATSIVAVGLRPYAGAASAVFLTAATAFHAAILAGTRAVRCNCFGAARQQAERIDPSLQPPITACRNAALIVASTALAGAPPGLCAGAAALAFLLIAAGLTRSISSERGILRMGTHPSLPEYSGTMRILQAHSWWLNGRPRPF